ncbi:GNAT family N-acetyltransferase [Lacticaseibacillus hulanensis]|uniref:GNAT family N-acetyltransferase n=1 Tax=Lacticaseibacillus hulanensis TaxID=2493111 RepID=UPI000FDB41FD|nr:GNAT family N-acetyltransferase [Lacticaseibacillus hulanensis]
MYTFAPIKDAETGAAALAIYEANAAYYQKIGEPRPTIQTVLDDAKELPPATPARAKHFWLVKQAGKPVAVLDLIEGYPDQTTLYIGQLEVATPRQGHGRAIIDQLKEQIGSHGYKRMELAAVHANKDAAKFWLALGFQLLRQVEGELSPGNQQLLDVYTLKLE